MFDKDRYSILAMVLFFLLFNPFKNILGISESFAYYPLLILIIPFVSALLFLNRKATNNRFLTIFLKALKICWLGYFIFLFLEILTRLNYSEGIQTFINTFAENLPNVAAYTFIVFVPIMSTTLISTGIATVLRNKLRPIKVNTEDHLLDN